VAIAALLVSQRAVASQIDYEMVKVGFPSNAADSTGRGAVDGIYRIGKFEVTIAQYAAFLNAVAKTDRDDLYNPKMGSDLNVAGIAREGSRGSYSYSVMTNRGDSANRPITYVSWFDAARFANWMSNGQPVGGRDRTTTEDGAYNLLSASNSFAVQRNAINPNTLLPTTHWIPTENEWYKAAYFNPSSEGGPSDSYWEYATKSDGPPTNYLWGVSNRANYAFDSTYAVTGSTYYSSSQNYLTNVGAFKGSQSYFGTFDQNGNVSEWNDLNGTRSYERGYRGGYWGWKYPSELSASAGHSQTSATWEFFVVGFRLAGSVPAAVPEISSSGLGGAIAIVIGAFGLLERMRAKTA
jgi:formylglycine-generating enzyme required for sulfatase activity